jgi:hypothetical protein
LPEKDSPTLVEQFVDQISIAREASRTARAEVKVVDTTRGVFTGLAARAELTETVSA